MAEAYHRPMSQPYREGQARASDTWDQWLERHDLDVLAQTRKALETNYENASAVFALVETQGREIARLQTIVLSLLRALGQSGAVDLDAIGRDAASRMAAAQIALTKPKPHGLQHPESLVSCDGCRESAVAKTTFITGAGTLCERCYAQRGDR